MKRVRSKDRGLFLFLCLTLWTCDPLQAQALRTIISFVQQREALCCLARHYVNDINSLYHLKLHVISCQVCLIDSHQSFSVQENIKNYKKFSFLKSDSVSYFSQFSKYDVIQQMILIFLIFISVTYLPWVNRCILKLYTPSTGSTCVTYLTRSFDHAPLCYCGNHWGWLALYDRWVTQLAVRG